MSRASEKEALLISESEQNSGENEEQKSCVQSLKGVIATFAQVLLFVVSATSVQLLERRIPDLELNTFRNAFPTVLYSLGVLFTGNLPVIQRDKMAVTFVYTVVTFTNGLFFFIAVTMLPAGMVASVVSTSYILFGLVVFSVCFNERITPRGVLLSVLCVCGVILIIQPWTQASDESSDVVPVDSKISNVRRIEVNYNSIPTTKVKAPTAIEVTATAAMITTTVTTPTAATMIPETDKTTVTSTTTTPLAMTSITKYDNRTSGKDIQDQPSFENVFIEEILQITGYVFAVLSGVTLTIDLLLVKRNPYFNENILEVLFWIFVSNTFFSVVIMLILETPVLPSNWFDTAMVAIHSFSYAGLWPLYIFMPKYISGNTLTAIMSTQVAFMLIAQYTVLSSILPGHRNWMEVMGVILVLIGSGASSVFEMFKNKKEDNDCEG